MLISKTVIVEINRGNLPYYSNRYNISPKIGDLVEIDVDKLPDTSKVEVLAICDYCECETNIEWRFYNKRFNKNGSFACSKKCAAIRTKENLILEYGVNNIAQVPYVKDIIKNANREKFGTDYYFGSDIAKDKNKEIFIEKYGVDNPLKSELVKEKMIKTNLEKWGVEWTLQNKEIRERGKITNLEKWGTETPSKNQEIKDKIIKTNQERWGGNSPMSNDIIKEKSKNTTLKNWGVDNPNKSIDIRKKSKNTNLEKYGVEYPTQSEIIIDKRRNNNLEKWGSIHVHQSDIFRKNNTKIGNNENYIEYKGNKISIFQCDYGLDHSFEINTDNFFSRTKQNIKLCTICNPIGNSTSFLENELFTYIKSIYGGKIIQSYRDGLEIDIYLPDLNLGFEFNGLFWHSENYRDKNYHIGKTEYFYKRGIRIIHIWEDDWVERCDIIKSQIKNLMFKNDDKISARKCVVREVELNECRNFLNLNHIQGYVNSSVKLGLYKDNQLVSLMTFDCFEGRKKMESGGWNLSRFCNLINISVVGAASKLLRHFINNYKPIRIVSYADRDWSEGNLYYKLGFDLISKSKPDYKYVLGGSRLHKSNFKKTKLKYKVTESEYIKSIGLTKIWDCGKMKFQMIL